MSTYVFSDVHGHRAPLERALERISPAEDDRFFCLGDMIDRGPDPIGVLRTVRALPNVRVLMGNHEDLMISCLNHPRDPLATMNWGINGGAATSDGLANMDLDEANELVDWVRGLPRWEQAVVGERRYLLVHAGVRLSLPAPESWDDESAAAYLDAQDGEDLSWIREEFWGSPRGLSGDDGSGPIVIAGHTPTPYLEHMASSCDRAPVGKDGRARMVRVGGDRWDIDCCAAGGYGLGQVLVLRLEDEEEFYEPVGEGE
ncbi:MAG TPA: serine/threonine protein phosphatase [Candidatus Olsenella pullicola]|nr:serine/threonine protein phosphatase [Candidatus Olsenella pullicola]